MSKPIFYVHVEARGVSGEIRLNDAPILPLSVDYAQNAFPTISEWVISGENRLSVHITRSEENPELKVSLCESQIGEVPDPDTEVPIAQVVWPPPGILGTADSDSDSDSDSGSDTDSDSAAIVPSIPPVLEASGDAVHPWGEWTWQKSPPFTGDSATVSAVATWVRDLHAYLAAGRVDALTGHSQVKFDEIAPIYDMDASEALERITQAWAYFQAQTGWELAPFDPNDLDLRVRCGGQLVEPCTRAGLPILRQRRPIDGELWSLPIFLARTNWGTVAGQLAIVR